MKPITEEDILRLQYTDRDMQIFQRATAGIQSVFSPGDFYRLVKLIQGVQIRLPCAFCKQFSNVPICSVCHLALCDKHSTCDHTFDPKNSIDSTRQWLHTIVIRYCEGIFNFFRENPTECHVAVNIDNPNGTSDILDLTTIKAIDSASECMIGGDIIYPLPEEVKILTVHLHVNFKLMIIIGVELTDYIRSYIGRFE